MAAEAAIEGDGDIEPAQGIEGVNESDSEEEEKFKPAPLTSISPRPRPTRAARPAPPRFKERDAEAPIPSGPTTPTAATHQSHSIPHGSFHADTEAWRESVATAAAHGEEWRESAVTAAVSENHYEPVKSVEDDEPSKPSYVPRLRKVASGASLGAFSPSSSTPPVSANTTTTMHSDSMSSAAPVYTNSGRFRPESRGGITTDGDSDADFQSAYSHSPQMNGESASEVERSGSGYGSGGYSKRRSRQIMPLADQPHPYAIARSPSYSGLSIGAVGGLGVTGTETDSRSRASSVGTNLASTTTERTHTSYSGSDHTVGAPETLSPIQDQFRNHHPPISRGTAAASGMQVRKDSGTSLTKSSGIHASS